MANITVAGFDPSLRNWGYCIGNYCTESKALTIGDIGVICPNVPTGKQIRQNSKDLVSAQALYEKAFTLAMGVQALFVEVPHGSQSSRATVSYAVCVGVLGSMRASGRPFYELTANEVKLATGLPKTASKQAMIDWATSKYPNAAWPTYNKNGKTLVTAAKAEHIADSIATIHAGLQLQEFQSLIAMTTH